MIWRKFRDTRYEVSEYGDIRNITTGRILKSSTVPKGYLHISLRIEETRKTFLIHRLVAETFLDNFSEEYTVDHIDRNKINNHFSNLRMMKNEENVSISWSDGSRIGLCTKKVLMINKNTGLLEKEFNSVSEASRELSLDRKGLINKIKNHNSRNNNYIYKLYIFKYS
jgi:thiamine biosynthesis protein ThiC